MQSAHGPQQGGLAAPARPQNADKLALMDRQRDIFKRMHLAGAGGVIFGGVVDDHAGLEPAIPIARCVHGVIRSLPFRSTTSDTSADPVQGPEYDASIDYGETIS